MSLPCFFVQTGLLRKNAWRQESFDLQGARRLLDEDHRGLEKVGFTTRGENSASMSALWRLKSDN